MGDNGSKPAGAHMELTFEPATFHLDVKFTGPNLDCALAMLDQARRWFENQLRAASAMKIQADMQRARAGAELAASLRTPRGSS
jgi:hypothetical protein